MLIFHDLRKTYLDKVVFSGLSFHLEKGIFALQGPNGIGKSTLLALISGSEELDAGDVFINGISLTKEPQRAHMNLSYVPDESPIYPFLTGKEFLAFVCGAKKIEDVSEVYRTVESFSLTPYLHTRFDAMSLGTRKKFLITAAMAGDPQVMLLDEPSNGLDAWSQKFLEEYLVARAERKVVLFSTHDYDFATKIGARSLEMRSASGAAGEVSLTLRDFESRPAPVAVLRNLVKK